jgi:hypothetical protein
MVDQDLEVKSRAELVEELRRVRSALREHREAGCWHNPKLWELLPENAPPRVSAACDEEAERTGEWYGEL